MRKSYARREADGVRDRGATALKSGKLEKAGTVDSKNTPPHGRWGRLGSVDPTFPAGLPFPVPETLEFVAFCDSENFFQQFSRDFPGVFLGNPGNSHSLLEFSDKAGERFSDICRGFH